MFLTQFKSSVIYLCINFNIFYKPLAVNLQLQIIINSHGPPGYFHKLLTQKFIFHHSPDIYFSYTSILAIILMYQSQYQCISFPHTVIQFPIVTYIFIFVASVIRFYICVIFLLNRYVINLYMCPSQCPVINWLINVFVFNYEGH